MFGTRCSRAIGINLRPWHLCVVLCPGPFSFSFVGLAFLAHLLLAENNGSLMLVNDFERFNLEAYEWLPQL